MKSQRLEVIITTSSLFHLACYSITECECRIVRSLGSLTNSDRVLAHSDLLASDAATWKEDLSHALQASSYREELLALLRFITSLTVSIITGMVDRYRAFHKTITIDQPIEIVPRIKGWYEISKLLIESRFRLWRNKLSL